MSYLSPNKLRNPSRVCFSSSTIRIVGCISGNCGGSRQEEKQKSLPRPGRCLDETSLHTRSSSLFSLSASIRTRRSKIGRRIVNVSPLPSLLSSDNSPPCSRTIRLTMSKPRPDPVGFVVKYGSKTLAQVFRRNAAARVRKTDPHMSVVPIGPNAQNAVTLHRFEAVLDRIVKNLLHLIPIHFQPRQIRAQFGFNDDVAILDLWSEKTAPLRATIALMSSG